MKKLFLAFLLLSFIPAPVPIPPFVTAEAYSVYTLSSVDTLLSTACEPGCAPLNYSWSKVSGPGVQTIFGSATNTAIVSGLQTGFYVFKNTVTSTTTGLTNSDTVGFIVNIPIYITLPPVIIHDTIKIMNPKTVTKIIFSDGTTQ